MKIKNTFILELHGNGIKFCLARNENNRIIIELSGFIAQSASWETELLTVIDKTRRFGPRLIISVSRTAFLMRLLSIPAFGYAEINQMLGFQLAKNIPYQVEDVSWNFLVLGRKENLSRLLVFILQNKTLEKLLSILKSAQCVPAVITITTCGLYTWLKYQNKLNANQIIAIVNAETSYMEFAAVNNKNILFSRAFIYSEESAAVEGVQQSLQMFLKEFPDIVLSKIFFTGIDISKKIITAVQTPKEYILSAKKNQIRENFDSTELASIIGLILNSRDCLDFSPIMVRQSRIIEKNKSAGRSVILIIIQIIAVIACLCAGYTGHRIQRLRAIEQTLNTLQVVSADSDKLFDRLKIMEGEFAGQINRSEIIEALILSLPEQAKLTSLDIFHNGEFSLQGYADNAAQVFAIANSLNAKPLLRGVSIKYVSKIKTNSTTRVEFNIFGQSSQTP